MSAAAFLAIALLSLMAAVSPGPAGVHCVVVKVLRIGLRKGAALRLA